MRVLLNSVALVAALSAVSFAQTANVRLTRNDAQKKVDVWVDGKFFTAFIYPDTLEKPVLYPLTTARGTEVTRGFPLNPRPGGFRNKPYT